MLRDKIEAAATLLLIPGTWTTEVEARNSAGHDVEYDEGNACKWCAYGALRAAGVTQKQFDRITNEHCDEYGMFLATFNDMFAKNAKQVAERLFEISQRY